MTLINRGQYGHVYRANTTAIKEMDIARAESWLIEIILTRTLKCDKLMTARNITITHEKVSITMNLAEYDLWSWRNKIVSVSMKDVRAMMGDVAIGLAYLHFCNILHSDLKPSNILVETSGDRLSCKITDFGYSSLLMRERNIKYGTDMYSCPECIIGIPTKFEADIWAFGLVISYAVRGGPPWTMISMNRSKRDKLWFISSAYHWALHTSQNWPYLIPGDEYNVEINYNAVFEDTLYDIMERCLSINRLNRPSAMDIVEELTDSQSTGIYLSPEEETCRCCDCNFDEDICKDMKLLLEGKHVKMGDRTHEFVDIASKIDFMPTLKCQMNREVYYS